MLLALPRGLFAGGCFLVETRIVAKEGAAGTEVLGRIVGNLHRDWAREAGDRAVGSGDDAENAGFMMVW